MWAIITFAIIFVALIFIGAVRLFSSILEYIDDDK